jgi:CTP:molybdopterin cytidylyltransferase MocA
MADTRNINGIVLAAGASSRMGEPKALLQVDGATFLERAVHLLREAGCKYVIAVVTDDLWIERLADVSGAAVIINDADDAEQIDSLRLGIANLPDDTDAVAVLPVDFPRISVETVKRLVAEASRSDAPILNPAYNGVAGHPVIFASRLFPELLAPDLPEGARTVIDAHATEAHVIDVDDPGVTIDVDTPGDYQKHVERGDTPHRS